MRTGRVGKGDFRQARPVLGGFVHPNATTFNKEREQTMLTMLVTKTKAEVSDGPDDSYTIVLEVGGVNHRLAEGGLALLLTPQQAAAVIAQILSSVKDSTVGPKTETFLDALNTAMLATGAGSVVESFDEG